MEVGDPLEVLFDPSFPVTLNGFTYHPQNVALLPWFARESPSSGFNGQYSFPAPLLASPAGACP